MYNTSKIKKNMGEMMDYELKLKIFVITVLWLPVVWFVWNQIFKFFKSKRRAQIGDMTIAILSEINKLNVHSCIDRNSSEAKKIIQKEKELWSQYEELLKEEEKLQKY